jgi:CcmD family protein
VKQVLIVSVLLSILMVGSRAALAQPAPGRQAAQDEFVPVKDLPAAEQLPAAPLLVTAYAFMWLATLGYVVMLWRRLGSVDRELAALRRDIAGRR